MLTVIVHPDGAMEAVNDEILSQYLNGGSRIAEDEEAYFYWESMDAMDDQFRTC